MHILLFRGNKFMSLWNWQKIRMIAAGQMRTVVTQDGIYVPSTWDACHSAPANGLHMKILSPG